MTEKEWDESTDPTAMLEFLRANGNDRKFRLFACACCRRAEQNMTNEWSRKAIEVAERFADGGASTMELRDAIAAMEFPGGTVDAAAYLTCVQRFNRPSLLLRYGIFDFKRLNEEESNQINNICWSGFQFPAEVALAVARTAAIVDCSADAAAQAALLHCIFRPFPLRHATIRPSWFSSTIKAWTQAMYTDRDFTDLPVLGDALEEAGCTSQQILKHCRELGQHVRGCWVADLILGKS